MGYLKKDSGTVRYKGRELGTDLSKNIQQGIVYLSEDRKDEGLILMHSVAENIALPNLDKLCRPFLSKRKQRETARKYIKDLKIKTFSELSEAKAFPEAISRKWLSPSGCTQTRTYIFSMSPPEELMWGQGRDLQYYV